MPTAYALNSVSIMGSSAVGDSPRLEQEEASKRSKGQGGSGKYPIPGETIGPRGPHREGQGDQGLLDRRESLRSGECENLAKRRVLNGFIDLLLTNFGRCRSRSGPED